MRFGREKHDADYFGSRHQPPPDYFSRAVQLKILVLVFLFLGVLLLMREVRKPERWHWMWQLQGAKAALPAAEPDPGAIATKPEQENPQAVTSRRSEVTAEAGLPLEVPNEQQSATAPSSNTAEADGWDFVLRRLSSSQRQSLLTGLQQARRGTSLASHTQADWALLLQQLDENWRDYCAAAARSLQDDDSMLTGQQRQTGERIIRTIADHWSRNLETLEGLGKAIPLAQDQTDALQRAQTFVDQWIWSQVQDDTVLRRVETDAWFRAWSMLQELTAQQVVNAKGPLNYVQLLSQPGELRGQLVRVKGTARWGYQVAAQDPQPGIDRYVVLGLLPTDGNNAPIVVYCLDLPDGFPRITSPDREGRGVRLDEDVEIVGYYFKRWSHRSARGMELSPLILGRITQWHPDRSVEERGPPARVATGTLLTALVAMAGLGALLALWVYRGTRGSAAAPASMQAPPTLPSFDTQPVRGGVSESLRNLAEEASGE